MPLEEGVVGWLIGGFSIVMGLVLLTLLLLWSKNRKNRSAYAWIVLHLLFFSLAIYFSLKAISFDYQHVMASEENSSQMGIAEIIWALSMVCLVIGIFKFSNSGKYSAS
jgi:hypothetical protein